MISSVESSSLILFLWIFFSSYFGADFSLDGLVFRVAKELILEVKGGSMLNYRGNFGIREWLKDLG